MTKRQRRPVKSDIVAGAKITDNEDATLEATRAVLKCSRTTVVRQGLSLVSETLLAALANGVSIKSVDDLRAFMAEKLRPENELAR